MARIRKVQFSKLQAKIRMNIWIAYSKVVKKVTEMLFVEMDLQVFTKEFFSCLKDVLKPYQIPVESLELTQNSVLEILQNDSEKYI